MEQQTKTETGEKTAWKRPPSKMELLMTNVRKMPLFRQLVPMEAGVGWPIPARKKAADGSYKLYVILPCYGQGPSPNKGERNLFPPLATITLDWDTTVPVEYVNLRYRSPELEAAGAHPVGTFPHPALEKYSTVGEYREARGALLRMYDELFDMLRREEGLTPEWTARFGELLGTLVEPGLLPYYRMLGPKFYAQFVPEKEH